MSKNYRIASGELTKEDFQTVKFNLQRWECNYGLSPREWDVDVKRQQGILDAIARTVILEFQTKIASRKFAVKTVSYPATWWDAFKERFFPANLLKRYPVKYEEVTLEASAYYPDLEIPNQETYVKIISKVKRVNKDGLANRA